MKFLKYKKVVATLILGALAITQVPAYAYETGCDDEENLYVPQPSQPDKECPDINWPSFPKPPVCPEVPEPPTKPEEPKEIKHLPYIVGYEDGTFRAERAVTREEFATMVARLLLEGNEHGDLSSFEDIRPNRYSNAYVGYLESLGIVSGYADGTFRPFDAITKNEAQSMVEKIQQIRKTRKVVTFNSDNTISRAEAVTALNSIFERDCSDAEIQNQFSDLESTHWAYNDILFAAVEHTHIEK
ncbi:S-layer homology domain-containing protein [Niameybacter massiliensis]|uniref:S-layer homology domain-containing protein n=1 Tax=Holtiella tumoricola TaxID=3018743 RepID=A0AA42DPY9_9FIRM|nr:MULTISPECIES: S-layer homology domain-containing protein [Lachnospirales]MDA3733080.1 S-layer homology domain-containing protein [Holtiella tumoricola]